jgi:hypothetical protein
VLLQPLPSDGVVASSSGVECFSMVYWPVLDMGRPDINP